MNDDLNPITGAIQDNMKTRKAKHDDAVFERKALQMLDGHRGAPSGRNFMAFRMRDGMQPECADKYRSNFNSIFPTKKNCERPDRSFANAVVYPSSSN